jgi:hypothetical protein
MYLMDKAIEYGADPERVVVWDTLSEFYLDTSQDDADMERIARTLADSPFSLKELSQIELQEVRPVCIGNLFVMPGGEWAGFDPDWLIPQCLNAQRTTRTGLISRVLTAVLIRAYPPAMPRQRIAEIRAQRGLPN